MTREIALANGGVAFIDDEDAERVVGRRWRRNPCGYAVCVERVGPSSRTTSMARLVMGAGSGVVVDHINLDKLDNRRANLRLCEQRQNAKNRPRHANNTSGYKGVYKKGTEKFWSAVIISDGQRITLGSFATPEAAAAAYDVAAKKHHGEFARLNFDPRRDWILPVSLTPIRPPRAGGAVDETLGAGADGAPVAEPRQFAAAPKKGGGR